MGFVPESKSHSTIWNTAAGRNRFLNSVATSLQQSLGYDVEIDAVTLKELADILDSHANASDGILDLIAYCTQMLVGRIKMKERLASIRKDMIRLQPRGGSDRDNGALTMPDLKGGEKYNEFMKIQRTFRYH